MKTRIAAALRRGFASAALAALSTGALAQVVMYEHDDFRGSSFTVSGDIENFAPLGVNDRVSSAEVRGGTWQLCSDSGYRGQCITLGPGRHASLRPFGMNDRVSSARRLPDGTAATVPAAAATAAIELFEHDQFQGRHLGASADTPNLAPLGFNDLVSSVQIQAGQWQLCEDADYRGRCITLGPGRHPSLAAQGMNDRVSSLRRVDGVVAPAPVAGAPALELYEHDDFGGRVFRASGPVANLQPEGFNDTASSAQVRSGRWEVCTDADYRGRCVVLEPGSYRHLRERDLNDSISSLRPLAPVAASAPGGGMPVEPQLERTMFQTWRATYPDGCVVNFDGQGHRTASEPSCTEDQNRRAENAMARRAGR